MQACPLGLGASSKSLSTSALGKLAPVKIGGRDAWGIMSPSSPLSPPIAAVHGPFAASPSAGTPPPIAESASAVDMGLANGQQQLIYTGDHEWDMFLNVATGVFTVAAGADFQPWAPGHDAVCPFSGFVVQMEMAHDRAKRLRAANYSTGGNSNGNDRLALTLTRRHIAIARRMSKALAQFLPVRLFPSICCARLLCWQAHPADRHSSC